MYNEMEYQEEYRMADLIRRQWLGIITAEEQAELEAWSLQEEHARLYAKIRNQAELQKRNLYVDGLDVDGVWHKLREQIADVPVRKRRFFTRYRVVACLLLLIGVGTLLVYNRYSRLQPSDLLVQSIHPGSSKAVLITNEGKQIILQDSLNAFGRSNNGDSEPCFRQHVLLQFFVHGSTFGGSRTHFVGTAKTLTVEYTVYLVQTTCAPVLQLQNLFTQCHPSHQIVYTLLDGK